MTVQTPPEPGHYPSAPPWTGQPEPQHAPYPPQSWAGQPEPQQAPYPQQTPYPPQSWNGQPEPQAWNSQPEPQHGHHAAQPWPGQQAPDPGHYPSSPPWAGQPEPEPEPPPAPHTAPLFGGTVAPYGSPENKHGQLLVRFPGEVHDLNRPVAPSWRPVVAWTFVLSALGIISVLRRSSQARRYGRPRRPYWIAFAVTLVAGAAFWWAAVINVAIPLYHYHQESGLTEQLQTSLVSDSRVTKKFGAVSAVECTSDSDRDAEGVRTYLCTFELSTGKTNGMYVNADTEGNWREKE
ncbi:hypothetical protein [Actinoplanes philippinensis]|uniref:hypothetical protein n=1 Tax=Actinoplanes philippinensis TaxID=35752 RepID=UPI003402906D